MKTGQYQQYSLAVLEYLEKNLSTNEFLGTYSLYQLGLISEKGKKETIPQTGKLLRPTLLLLTMEGLNADWKKGIPVAAGIELFHTATLLVDDWQDQDKTRRGRKALWTLPEVGERQTVNIGLFLFTLSSKIISSFPEKVHSLFEQAKMDVIRGQQMDISFEEKTSITVEEYMKMIEFKTARLIQSSVLLGALLGNTDTYLYENLSIFGKQLGLLFQLQDDYLGVFGNTEVMGKPADDIVHRKKSLPLVLAIEEAVEGDKKVLQELYEKKDMLGEQDVERIMSLLKKLSIQEKTRDMIESTYNKALVALDSIPDSFSKKEDLRRLADFFANREK